jgi:hypothetical protein
LLAPLDSDLSARPRSSLSLGAACGESELQGTVRAIVVLSHAKRPTWIYVRRPGFGHRLRVAQEVLSPLDGSTSFRRPICTARAQRIRALRLPLRSAPPTVLRRASRATTGVTLMIAAALDFIRDRSLAGSCERIDFRMLVESVAADDGRVKHAFPQSRIPDRAAGLHYGETDQRPEARPCPLSCALSLHSSRPAC